MRALLLLALAACSEGPDPHEVVGCSAYWVGNATRCELACAPQPTAGVDADGDTFDDTCMFTFENRTGRRCKASDVGEFDGVRGCCTRGDFTLPQAIPIAFFECEGQ